MKIGIALGTVRSELWESVTVEADRLGFESVWMPEHLVLPLDATGSPYAGSDHPPIPAETPVFDAFATLSYLAGRTERIRLGTQVYNIGLRHPFVVARGVATLDRLSLGRFEFGIGASWLAAEWEAVGLPFDRRAGLIDESISVCQRLWSEPEIEHHGEHFDFAPVRFEPKPRQRPWPPLHIGGDGRAALRRAATVGDGWIPMNHTLEQIPEAARHLARLRAEAGRQGTVEITLGAPTSDLEGIRRCADAGVGRVLVRPWARSRHAIEGLHRFADEVLEKATLLPVREAGPG
ncbi:MAG: TIGR03619 family F420-dependent LLM class oxidoreductase [Acidimicrobiales bacterium]